MSFFCRLGLAQLIYIEVPTDSGYKYISIPVSEPLFSINGPVNKEYIELGPFYMDLNEENNEIGEYHLRIFNSRYKRVGSTTHWIGHIDVKLMSSRGGRGKTVLSRMRYSRKGGIINSYGVKSIPAGDTDSFDGNYFLLNIAKILFDSVDLVIDGISRHASMLRGKSHDRKRHEKKKQGSIYQKMATLDQSELLNSVPIIGGVFIYRAGKNLDVFSLEEPKFETIIIPGHAVCPRGFVTIDGTDGSSQQVTLATYGALGEFCISVGPIWLRSLNQGRQVWKKYSLKIIKSKHKDEHFRHVYNIVLIPSDNHNPGPLVLSDTNNFTEIIIYENGSVYFVLHGLFKSVVKIGNAYRAHEVPGQTRYIKDQLHLVKVFNLMRQVLNNTEAIVRGDLDLFDLNGVNSSFDIFFKYGDPKDISSYPLGPGFHYGVTLREPAFCVDSSPLVGVDREAGTDKTAADVSCATAISTLDSQVEGQENQAHDNLCSKLQRLMVSNAKNLLYFAVAGAAAAGWYALYADPLYADPIVSDEPACSDLQPVNELCLGGK